MGELRIVAGADASGIKKLLGANDASSGSVDPSQMDLEVAKNIMAGLQFADNVLQRAFEPDVIAALALLKDEARGDFAEAKNTLKALKVPIADVQSAIKEHQAKLRIIKGGEHLIHTAGDFLADAPIPDLVIPSDYRLHPDKTTMSSFTPFGFSDEVIAHGALLITGRTRDIDGENEGLRVSWKRGGAWRHKIVDRGVIANARELVALANSGFPVTSSDSKAQVEYFAKFEAENYSAMPVTQTTSHLGWQGPAGNSGFLIGREFIQPNGESAAAEMRPDSMEWASGVITFRGSGPGDDQIIEGYSREGTLAGWIATIEKVKAYPRVLAAIYTSFVPPMLRILDCPNFVLDLCSRTSQGKTSTQRAAASPWGNPDERKPGAALQTWDATKVYIERASALLGGLPLILDDTKRAKDPRLIAETLYGVTSGRGRGRGTIPGVAVSRTWHTVLISSGEQPVTSFTNDGGTRMRVLEIEGAPFGKQNVETGKVVETLNLGVRANYGHAGPEFVRFLIKNREKWPEWKREFHQLAEAYIKLSGSERAGRLATYAAAVVKTAELVHEALGLPWSFEDPVEQLWKEIAGEAEDPLGSRRAMRLLLSWAWANESRFFGREETNRNGEPVSPSAGWIGRWERGADFEYIAFYPHHIEKFLKDHEFNHDSILGEWRERKWLDLEGDDRKRFTKRVRIRGEGTKEERPHCVVVNRGAIDTLD